MPLNKALSGGEEAAAAPRMPRRPGHSTALAVLAVSAVILLLHWAKDVLVPIALAVFVSYLLMPAVQWLKRRLRVPLGLGAALILALLVGGTVYGALALEPQARSLLDLVPQAARKLDLEIRRSARDRDSTVSKVREAAAEVEKAAASAAGAGEGAAKPPKAAETPPALRAEQYFWVGTTSALVVVGNAVVVAALVYLLLVAGDAFKRKIVRISGERLSEKRITVEILEEIDRQVQRYLLAHVSTSVLLGVANWGVFTWIGLDNAAFWAVASALLHLIPYVGSAITVVATGLVGYLQFDALQPVLLLVGSQLLVAVLIGMMLLPWVTERVSRINAVTVFIALLFWGWLWGVWGLLLSVPIMMMIKAVCERMEGLQGIAELLGHEAPRPKAAPRGP